jgi:type IV secretory pathway VirB4 component
VKQQGTKISRRLEGKMDTHLELKLKSQERRAQLLVDAKKLAVDLEDLKRKANLEKMTTENQMKMVLVDKKVAAQVEAAVAKDAVVSSMQKNNLRWLAERINAASAFLHAHI